MKKLSAFEKQLNRVPSFMRLDFSLIENFDDLLFHLAHEIDLAEEGDVDPAWTSKQLHRAKMFAATVKIAAEASKV